MDHDLGRIGADGPDTIIKPFLTRPIGRQLQHCTTFGPSLKKEFDVEIHGASVEPWLQGIDQMEWIWLSLVQGEKVGAFAQEINFTYAEDSLANT